MTVEQLQRIVREYLYASDLFDSFIVSGEDDPEMYDILVRRIELARKDICKAANYSFGRYES